MVTKGDSLDGSKATVNVAFPHTASWSAVSEDASNWLWKFVQDRFLDQSLYLFLAGLSPVPDDRLNRYKIISKRASVKLWLDQGCKLIDEGFEKSDSGLYLWSLLVPSENTLPSMIDNLRSDRGSFLFLFDKEPKYEGFFSCIMKSRADGSRVSIDKTQFVSDLCRHGLIPIRIFGLCDDRELSVEIYTQSPTANTDSLNVQ